MKFNIQKLNKYSVAADTDSMFLTLYPILKKKYPEKDFEKKEEVLLKIKPLQKEIGEKINSFQTPAAKKLFNCSEHYFELKPEFIVKKAYWSGKRRYAQFLVDREGKSIEKFVMMGLDIMKSNFGPYFSKFGEQLIKNILLGKSKKEIDKYVMDFKKSIATIEWKKLLKPSGLKKIEEYIELPPQAGEMFSRLRKKCPQNTKAAIITNDLIRFYNLQNKYPEFVVGDKINVVILKDNPYKIDVIGLNGYNDPPEILKIVEKFIDREGLFDSIMRNKLATIYDDLEWTLNLNPYNNIFEMIEI